MYKGAKLYVRPTLINLNAKIKYTVCYVSYKVHSFHIKHSVHSSI